MRHPNSRTLHAYWDARRRGGSAPARADIAPQDLGALLSHLFLLRRMDQDHHVFRLAGTGLCRLHQREFRDQNFLSLWSGHDRTLMSALLEGALGAPAPASALADAVTLDGRACAVELTVLPLRGPEGQIDRVLGLYQPLDAARLGGRPVVRHRISLLNPARLPDPSLSVFAARRSPARPALAANDG
ncbi:MAG: PAS domain-containing protein [Oceanicaulis sp.]|nr:PAS domain-containing protein [Oceanicaulis sp.]